MEVLQTQIDELKAQIQQLKSANTIPRDIETAFVERLNFGDKLEGQGTGSAGTTSVYNGFPVTVPANPTGTLLVEFNGITYELLYK